MKCGLPNAELVRKARRYWIGALHHSISSQPWIMPTPSHYAMLFAQRFPVPTRAHACQAGSLLQQRSETESGSAEANSECAATSGLNKGPVAICGCSRLKQYLIMRHLLVSIRGKRSVAHHQGSGRWSQICHAGLLLRGRPAQHIRQRGEAFQYTKSAPRLPISISPSRLSKLLLNPPFKIPMLIQDVLSTVHRV